MPLGTFRTLGPFDIPGCPPTRQVRVYLPKGASPSSRRPALYMFDAQNLFEDEGSYAGGWHVHRAVDALRGGVVPPVVIGLEHGGEQRISELSPWDSPAAPGRADALFDWIVGTLVPLTQAELPIIPGPVGAVLGGSSMGGLAALYGHFRHPDVFGGALSMSPAFWVGGGRLFDFVDRTPTPYLSRVYLDCGVKEGGGRMVLLAERMARKLADRGYSSDQLMWRPDARGTHSERAWRRRLPKALRFMFRP